MVSLKSIKIRSWARLLAIATLTLGHLAYAEGLVSDNGQLSVSGTNIVNQNGDTVQLRGMSSHGVTFRWLGPDGAPLPIGDSPGRYTTSEAIQWTRDHWGANAFRAAMYVETWGLADPRNWQHGGSYYEKDNSPQGYQEVSGVQYYETEGGFENSLTRPVRLHKGYMDNLDEIIQWAIDLNMYVVVDWHVLEEGTPVKYKEEAKLFFKIVSERWGHYPNIIYEIANEPNKKRAVDFNNIETVESEVSTTEWSVVDFKYESGDGVPVGWPEIKSYAEEILPIIRANSPTSIVTVGTPQWDQLILTPLATDPADSSKNLTIDDDNVMYSLHFYACEHPTTSQIFIDAKEALERGLPIFVSEMGSVDADGNGNFCPDETDLWLDYLDENNVSWFNWALSGKDEAASVLIANTPHNFAENASTDALGIITDEADLDLSNNLTPQGVYIKCRMSDCNSTLEVLDGAMNLSAFTTIDLATLNAANTDLAGATYTLIDNAGGQAILNGSTVTFNALASFTGGNFTYQAEVNGVLSNEATISVNLTDSVTCDWHLDKDTDFYNNHWNGTLLVSNNSASEINEWTIEVTTSTNTRLGSVWWTAPVYSNSTENTDGTVTYSISDQGWDGNIPAGGSRQVVVTGHVLSDLQSWEPGFNGFDQSGIESFAGDCASTVNGLINYDFNFMAPVTGSTISDSRNHIELHWFNDTDEVPIIRDENDNTFALTPGFYSGPNETWRGVEVATFANKVSGRFDQWAAATGLDMSAGTHSWVLEAGGSVSDPFTFTAAITSHEYTCELELITVGIPDNLYTWIGRLKIKNVGSTAVTNWNTEFKWFEIPPTLNANYWILGDNPHFNTFGSPEATRVWQSYPNDPNNDFEEAKALVTPTGTVNIAPGASESYLVSASGLRATPRMYCGGLND